MYSASAGLNSYFPFSRIRLYKSLCRCSLSPPRKIKAPELKLVPNVSAKVTTCAIAETNSCSLVGESGVNKGAPKSSVGYRITGIQGGIEIGLHHTKEHFLTKLIRLGNLGNDPHSVGSFIGNHQYHMIFHVSLPIPRFAFGVFVKFLFILITRVRAHPGYGFSPRLRVTGSHPGYGFCGAL